jgi:hypothetical protein
MKRDIETRLRKLEACHFPSSPKPLHFVVCDNVNTADKCEAHRRGMIETSRAEESDDFIFIIAADMPQVI